MKQTTILVMLVALVAVTGCIGSSDIGSIGQNVIGSNHLTITDSYAEVGKTADMYIIGTIRNDGNDMFQHGDMKITIYDSNGNVIKETVGAVYRTYPGETSDFRSLCAGNQYRQAASYKIEIVHQNWGDIDEVKTMHMVTTATGKITPVATPTPTSASGKTSGDIIIKYPITAYFTPHYADAPDEINRLTIELTADGKTNMLFTNSMCMHKSGYVWELVEHDSDSYKYDVSDEPYGYAIPDDRRKYMTVYKDGTAILENECDETAQGYWTRAI